MDLEAQNRYLTGLLAKATAFDFGEGMAIKRCTALKDHWVISLNDWQILDKNGQWVYEPARRHHLTSDFLERTRFATLDEAIHAINNISK